MGTDNDELGRLQLIFTSHKETAHGLHTCHHGSDHIHNTAEEIQLRVMGASGAFGKDQLCHGFCVPPTHLHTTASDE